jgi:hypothetical protein
MTNAVKLSFKSFSDASAAFTDGNTLAGIASMASGIMGIASAAIAAGKAIWDHLFGSAGRDAVTTFAASLGGFDVLQKKLEKLGAAGQQLWINLTQGVGKNDPAAAKKAIDAVNAALDAQATKIATVQSQIEALGGTTGPTYTQLTDLQKKYNLTAAQMGPSFQTASVHSSFQSLIDDMDELTRGGADVNAALFSVGDDGAKALSGLGTAIQGDIQASEQAGVDIPENLKTAAKALFDQGQLLDANGKKVTDFSTVKFGETMQTSLDNLNKTLKDLVNALTGSGSNSLSGALETIGNKTVSPRIKPIYDSSGLPQDYQSPSTYRTPSPTSAAPAGGSSMQVQLVLQDGRMLAETVVPYIPSVADSLGVGIHR